MTDFSVINLIENRRDTLEFIELQECSFLTTELIPKIIESESLLFKIGLSDLFLYEEKEKVDQMISLLQSKLPRLYIKKPNG